MYLSSAGQSYQSLSFEDYSPVSTLVVPQHHVSSSRFPFIDVHNHQYNISTSGLSSLINEMDKMNMKVMVNLSGRSGAVLKRMTNDIKANGLSNRILVFANIQFDGLGERNWEKKTIQQLEEDVKNGAKGLKVFKELGMFNKDVNGKRIPVDDPRLDPVWKKCGELGIPVLIHSAAPKAFWQPLDKKNERWLEMVTHRDRLYTATSPAAWETIIAEQHRMFKKHPQTIFINAHFGWFANDLGRLAMLMDEIPNMYIEFGAVIAEIGRQPKMATRFFNKYQDRILFGKDSWAPPEYSTYFRVLETEDEYFPYHKKYHAFWSMYGLGLPDAVLRKVYYKNALRIIPGIDKAMFPE
jgi:predicted TIM-barrel fold metal-dependent hydrolase